MNKITEDIRLVQIGKFIYRGKLKGFIRSNENIWRSQDNVNDLSRRYRQHTNQLTYR